MSDAIRPSSWESSLLYQDLLRPSTHFNFQILSGAFRIPRMPSPLSMTNLTLKSGQVALFGDPVLEQPPHSSDLAPSDYTMFSTLKEHLRGKKLSTVNEIV